MLFSFQVGGYGSAEAFRSMELWAERAVPMVERALGMLIGEIEGGSPRCVPNDPGRLLPPTPRTPLPIQLRVRTHS